MRKRLAFFWVVLLVPVTTLCLSGAASAESVCRVMDPTATPLNVRTSPNGNVAGTLENGVQVVILDRTSQSGKPWAFVGKAEDRAPIGWVLQNYLDCSQSAVPGRVSSQVVCRIMDPTGTPLNIRTSPNGNIVGTLQNGVQVAILDQTSQGGKQWVYVGKAEDRAPIGWVFLDYLDCSENAAPIRPF